jgi:hypothetical protein
VKYKDGRGRRGTFSDTREGDNAEGNDEHHGQQGRRNGYRADFRAEIGTRRRRGNGGRRDRIQESRSRPNESQHFPRKLQEIDIVAIANGMTLSQALATDSLGNATYDPLMRTVEASSSSSGRKKKRSRDAVSKQRGEYTPRSKFKYI